jgi:hypothetical protein
MGAFLPLFYTTYKNAPYHHYFQWYGKPVSIALLDTLRGASSVMIGNQAVHALFFRGENDTVWVWDCVNGMHRHPPVLDCSASSLVETVAHARATPMPSSDY